MPCRYDESAEEIAARQKASKKALIQPYKIELDKVTRLLCFVMKTLGEGGPRTYVEVVNELQRNSKLQSWWKEHQRRDERRKINETAELRTKALKKLTAEEKKALGLTK